MANPLNDTKRWMVAMALHLLESEGYECKLRPDVDEWLKPRGSMTPKELADKAGLSAAGLWRRLHHEHCPPFEADRGESGRIIAVEVNERLLAFVCKPRNAGSPMEPVPTHTRGKGKPAPQVT